MASDADPDQAAPAYHRLIEEGALYRRRVSVPPQAAFVHGLLGPIAEELQGRLHDDDGRLVIEWLERFWPHDVAGHGRSDGFRWSVIGSTDSASVLVLITQSLVGARSSMVLDVVVAPLRGTLGEEPSVGDHPAQVFTSTSRAGVHFWMTHDLTSLHGATVRALVRAGIAAVELPTVPGPAWSAVTRARSAAVRPRSPVAALVITALLAVALFAGGSLEAAVIGTVLIVAAAALWRKVRPSQRRPGSTVDDQTSRLEEGRDIPDYQWGSG